MRHLLSDKDLSSHDVDDILSVAMTAKRDPRSVRGLLLGSTIGLFFEKPSLRTRVSAETACTLLGAYPVVLRREELHLERGETPEDSARVLSGYLDLLMGRVLSQSTLERFAAAKALPILNGLSDMWHPLQALTDLLTIQESFNGRLKGLSLAYYGDFNNVASSLAWCSVLAGLNVILVCPESYSCPEPMLIALRSLAESSGGSVVLAHDPVEAASDVDVLYTDVWVSMGDEAESQDRIKTLAPYQLNSQILSLASRNAIVLHCLPATMGEEITREVFDSPNSRIIQQAHNRFPVAVSVLLFLLARERFENIAVGR